MMQVSPRFPQTSGWMPNRPEYEAKSTLHQTIQSNGRKCVQSWDEGFRIGRVSCYASHVMQNFFSGYIHKSGDLAVNKPTTNTGTKICLHEQ